MNFVYGKKNLMQEGNATPLNPIYSSLVKSPFMSSYVYNEQDQLSPNYEDTDLFGMANPAAVTGSVQQEIPIMVLRLTFMWSIIYGRIWLWARGSDFVWLKRKRVSFTGTRDSVRWAPYCIGDKRNAISYGAYFLAVWWNACQLLVQIRSGTSIGCNRRFTNMPPIRRKTTGRRRIIRRVMSLNLCSPVWMHCGRWEGHSEHGTGFPSMAMRLTLWRTAILSMLHCRRMLPPAMDRMSASSGFSRLCLPLGYYHRRNLWKNCHG